jgi:hypothetical protein
MTLSNCVKAVLLSVYFMFSDKSRHIVMIDMEIYFDLSSYRSGGDKINSTYVPKYLLQK